MLPATLLKLALFAFAAAAPCLAHSQHRDSAGDNHIIDVQARDDLKPMHARAFVAGYLYGREFADEPITARGDDKSKKKEIARKRLSDYPRLYSLGEPTDFGSQRNTSKITDRNSGGRKRRI